MSSPVAPLQAACCYLLFRDLAFTHEQAKALAAARRHRVAVAAVTDKRITCRITGCTSGRGGQPWTWVVPAATALRSLLAHIDGEHGDRPEQVRQLDAVTFHEQALAAIRTLAASGRPFTIGECHPLVTVAPHNPAVDWPRAQREAERLGWITHHGFGRSIVPGTKSSACSVWVGTSKAQGRAA